MMSETNFQTCPYHMEHTRVLQILQDEVKVLHKEDDKLDDKINKMENNANSTFNNLSEKILTLEITTKINNENLNAKIDKLDKKIDKLVENIENNEGIKSDRKFSWLQGAGLVTLGAILAFLFSKLS